MLAFLSEENPRLLSLHGIEISSQSAREILQELIPASIEVRGVCSRSVAVVAAAPHTRFDNWSEYFCNRAASKLGLGRVIATNYRDQDGKRIPVSIGRHIHVNRPFESDGPGELERETTRAREIHEKYLAALRQASGRETLPMDLLVEFHSQRQTPFLEIATTGLPRELAQVLSEVYRDRRASEPLLPELRIEPLHELQWRAEMAKARGSLRPEVTAHGMHVEIPRNTRRAETFRAACSAALVAMIASLLERLESQPPQTGNV